MMEMPLAADAVDGVWCREAFAHVRPDRRTVFFRQVHRVLRPGGALYLGAETRPLGEIARQYLLWRAVYKEPVVFWEHIDRLPPDRGGGRRYQAMTDGRTLRGLCRDHGFRVLSLRRTGTLRLLLARKKG
jgi:SAM-dependent methyltransferase